MSGKAYTMKEMKSIVDYLVEHKAFSETKGRKMWITFASTQLTTRTWQSLKETFLKRILPDIQNPYYKLTMEQVRSFKEGLDIEAKMRNKLDIQTISDDSNPDGETEKNGDKPNSSNGQNNEEELPKGEDIQSAQITSRNRASVETLVLDDPYYSNAEEIQNVLENTTESNINEDMYKPLKDCIMFEQSEPFNLDAIKVLEDFATDSEGTDKEPRMEIDENPKEGNENENDAITAIEINDSEETPDLPINPIEPDVNIVVFGKETEDSVDQDQPNQIDTNNAEAVPINDQPDKDQNDATDIPPNVIEDQSVVVSDQSEINNEDTDVVNNEVNVDDDVYEVNNDIDGESIDKEENKNKDDNDKEAVNNVEKKDKETTQTSENNATTKAVTVRADTDKTKVDDNEVIKEAKDPLKNDRISDVVPSSNVTNTSSNITDSIIPNNQEALNKVTNTQAKTQVTPEKLAKTSRKRSTSHESDRNKKMKMDEGFKKKENKIKVVETQAISNDKTDIRRMESEDLFNDKDTERNKDTFKPIEVKNQVKKSDDKVMEIHDNEADVAKNNPCLKSVSLYAEQFNTTKYNDSDSDIDITEKSSEQPKKTENNSKTDFSNDPILLKSHSESDDNNKKVTVTENKAVETVKDKVKKESALAKMLGFVGGTVNRKRRISHKRSRTNRHSLTIPSGSSEWTSESEDEAFISPPRGRRNRQTRKYLKPKSAKILSLNEEGGLFVMHGKKIFPLVKDGRNVKNYLSYHITSDSDEEHDSYWRQKYVLEKIRADELEKRLRTKEAINSNKQDVALARKSPILQSNTSLRNQQSHKQNDESANKIFGEKENVSDKEVVKTASSSQEKLKICFTKNNQEVQLEGYWPQIHPALQQVVELLHTDNDVNGKSKANTNTKVEKKIELPAEEIETVNIDSGKTTPIIPTVDPEIHEKVSQIENEIFKEIEKRAKEEEPKPEPKPIETENDNVTKRGRGRNKKSITTSTSKTEVETEPSKPTKRVSRKSSKTAEDKQTQKQDETASKQVRKDETIPKNDVVTTNQDKKQDETVSKKDDTAIMKRPSRTPKRHINTPPVENRMSTRRSTSRKSEQIDDEEEVRYKLPPNRKDTIKPVRKRSSHPGGLSLRSAESTQSNQDSDVSPITKRRRKTIVRLHKNRRIIKKKSLPNLAELFSSDSNNSAYFIPVRKSQSTLNSDIYKTDSYLLLTANQKRIKILDPIKEDNIEPSAVRHFNSVTDTEQDRSNSTNNILVEICSSSNVSLPPSPELSVVENLTLSREKIKPNITLNDTVNVVGDENANYNKYTISGVDVSFPLMGQECGIQNSNENVANKKAGPVSKSLIAKVSTKEKSASETINKKLHDLLLESAKKIENMDVDASDIVQTKIKAKKRCSTPRKRVAAKKTAPVNSVIEEEHMESCSFASRNTCPPVITLLSTEENVNSKETAKKGRKKKDIIKVKILRPKSRAKDRSSKNSEKSSLQTDSGINETECFSGMFLKGNDSVDLIHNHSDTCLHANECIGDSLELIENTTMSIISLNSNSSDSELKRLMRDSQRSADTFSNDAQDISTFTGVPNIVEEIFRTPSATLYNSPALTNNSLITEDLSNDIPSPSHNNWYLLSEDDTNTQKFHEKRSSFGANLNHIFTACAVPNLSTITEKSADSRKVTDVGDTDNTQNCDSQSLF